MARTYRVLLIVALAACTEPTREYTIAGTWTGTSAQGMGLTLTLAQSGESVAGTGSYTLDGSTVPFTLRNDAYLRDSVLYSAIEIPETACQGTLTGAYGRAQSDGGQFTAHFTCAVSIEATLTRQ